MFDPCVDSVATICSFPPITVVMFDPCVDSVATICSFPPITINGTSLSDQLALPAVSSVVFEVKKRFFKIHIFLSILKVK
jgi:hypothetical protein